MKIKNTMMFLLVVLILLAGMPGFAALKADAADTEQIALDRLEAMGITDALRDRQQEAFVLDVELDDCYCFASDSNAMVYLFYKESGQLRNIQSYALVYPELETPAAFALKEMTAQEREQASLEIAAQLIQPDQIGQLQVEDTNRYTTWDHIYVAEYYNGVKTGTRIMLAWDGSELRDASVSYGKIFKKDAMGNVIPAHNGDMISMEQAIALAWEDCAPNIARRNSTLLEDKTQCQLQVFEGAHCYMVSFYAKENSDCGCELNFIVMVDPYTGEIVQALEPM